MKKRVKYTREQIEFILENYVVNPDKCVQVTGHSIGSIKSVLQNISYDYTGEGLSHGSKMYTEVCDLFRAKNKMSINKWLALYL